MNTRADRMLRAGLVGTGGIAQVVHLPILKKLDDVELLGVYDLDVSKATMVANKFNIPGVFEDVEEMLHTLNLDVLLILTPTNFHLPISLMALKKGVHLFIEKPAGRNSREARRIAEEAARQNCHVMVGMQNRFRTDVRSIKGFLEAQEFGEVYFSRIGWLQAIYKTTKQPWIYKKKISGGGVMMDLGIQLIDLIWWLKGKPECDSAKAMRYQIRDDLEVEDFLVAFLQFKDDFSVVSEFSWDFPIARDRFYMEIFGKRGTVNLSPLKIQKLWNGQILNITPEGIQDPQLIYKQAYENEIRHFVQFLQGKITSLESPIEDAVQVQQIIDGLYASMETQKEIVFANVRE